MIETRRLILRELCEDDFEAEYAVLSDTAIMQYYPYSFDEARVKSWIKRNIERYQNDGFGLWAVVVKETGEMIGGCGLTMQNINGTIQPEIGYHIHRSHQRNGYANEAASAVRSWAFEHTPYQTLYSYMNAENTASRATAKSIGMQHLLDYTNEEKILTSVYAIKKEDWTMADVRIIKLKDRPELKEQAANWFHEKWGVPVSAYLESMNASLCGDQIQEWYLCVSGDRIIAGMGEIQNDFHNRKDLSPNICAVYTEPEYRCMGIAGKLLNFVVEDNRVRGISPLYLVTDHVGFYERYGWEFLCMVQGDDEPDMTRMYIHR